MGPDPACVRSTAAAISARSAASSVRLPAVIHPSTCCGERAPTIAPLTPGQLSVQATATAAIDPPYRDAIGCSASRRGRLRLGRGLPELRIAAAPVITRHPRNAFAAEGVGEDAGLHRAVGDDPGTVRGAPGNDVRRGLAMDQ